MEVNGIDFGWIGFGGLVGIGKLKCKQVSSILGMRFGDVLILVELNQ